MSFNFLDQGYMPEDSYSRQIDRRVAEQEYPYGYVIDEPPAGHVNSLSDAMHYGDKSIFPQRGLHANEPKGGSNNLSAYESKVRRKM